MYCKKIAHFLLLCVMLSSQLAFTQETLSPIEEEWNQLYTNAQSFLRTTQKDSVLYYQNKAKELSEKNNCDFCKAGDLLIEMEIEYYQSLFQNTIDKSHTAIDFAKRIHSHRILIRMLEIAGYAHMEAGQQSTAIRLFLEALDLAKTMNKQSSEGDMLAAIARLHQLQGNHKTALDYGEQAFEKFKLANSKIRETVALNAISNAYEMLGDSPKALENLNRILSEEYRGHISIVDSARTYNNIGRIYQRNDDMVNAIQNLEKAMAIYKAHSFDMRDQLYTLNELMTVYKLKEDYNKALQYADQIFPAVDTFGDIYLQRNAYLHLSDIQAGRGEFEKAYAAELTYGSLKDSISRIKEKRMVLELDEKYQSQVREAEIELLAKEKELATTQRNLLIGSLLLALLLGLGAFQWYQQRQQRQQDLLKIESEKLQELDQLKNNFFANITHELRTPITLILSPINALQKGKFGQLNEPVKEVLQLVNRNSKKLLSLVEEILDLAKLDVNKLELQEKAIEFKPLVMRLFAGFKSIVDIKGISYQISYLATENLILQLDPSKFEKIINNLLSNALKHTSKGDRIDFVIDETAKDIIIKVKDTGTGIHPSDLPKVFERFYQSTRKDAKTEGGTGIGLALALEYAKLFAGNLTVDSTFGQSTTFTLIFPKRIATPDALITNISPTIEPFESPVLATANTHSKGKAPKILLVEDNDDMRQYIVSLLETNYKVSTATNGKLALKKLRSTLPPDLIISDLMMPEMDGFTLVNTLKQNEDWKHIPIIMLTARAAETDKLNGLRIGIDDYITKPFLQEELLIRIQNLIQRNYTKTIERNPSSVPENASQASKEPPSNEWLEKVETILLRELTNRHYNMSSLSHELHLSQSQLTRRIKRLTGLTPNKYLQDIRLHKAQKHLENKDYLTVAEVSYAIGFEDPQYFSRLYYERFGKKPSAYLKI